MSAIKQASPTTFLSVMLMQVQFSPIEQIQNYIPDFQEYLQKNGYPLFSSRQTDIVCLGQQGGPEKIVYEQWFFSSSDTQHSLILASEKLTYQVFDIQGSAFETNHQHFLSIIKAFDAIAGISSLSQLGLRFIHSIPERDDVSWKDLVANEFQGPSFFTDGDWVDNELRFISAQRGVFIQELGIHSNFCYAIRQNAKGRKYPEGIERFSANDTGFFDPKCLVTYLDLDNSVLFPASTKCEIFDQLPPIFSALNSVIEKMFFGSMLTEKAKKIMRVPGYSIPKPLPVESYPFCVEEAEAAYGQKENGTHSVQPYPSTLDTDGFAMPTAYTADYKLYRRLDVPFQLDEPCVCSWRVDNRSDTSVDPNKTDRVLVLKDHNEQFVSLSRFFGFNKTEWAEIFSVSRQTIYGWLKNELKPSGENASKISRLYSLLNAIPSRQEDDRLFKRYIYHHISVCNCSLFEIFKSGLPSGYAMSDLVEIVSSLLERAQKKANELDKLEKTGLASEATLDHNLDDLLNCLD